MITPTHDAVAIHAYHAWEAEGRPHGRHEHHWFSAEAALTRGAAPAAVAVAPVKAAEAAPAKAPATRKAAAPKQAPQPKAAAAKAAAPVPAPKAPAEAVVAAAALAAPRAARSTAKGARRAH